MKLINLMLLTIVWAFPKSMVPKHTVQHKHTVDYKQLAMNHLMAKKERLQKKIRLQKRRLQKKINFDNFMQKYLRPSTTRIVYALF